MTGNLIGGGHTRPTPKISHTIAVTNVIIPMKTKTSATTTGLAGQQAAAWRNTAAER
jgi:hypothetical protein